MASTAPLAEAADDPFRGVTVHVVYDSSYHDWELKDMLPNRIRTEVGLAAQTHFMSLDNAEEVMARIPVTDFVFNYCDGSVDGEFVLADKLFKRFPLCIGAGPAYLRATEKKSVMDALLRAAGLPVLDTVPVDKDTVGLPATKAALAALGLPLFVKVNAGYDSLGLTPESICASVDAALERCKLQIELHGPVVVQRFLSGREFTVPTAFRRAYRPTEKILPPENFYFSWMKDEKWRTLEEREPDNIQEPLMKLAATAYNACSGDSYGRVDIRQDAHTKELFVLEVNSVCSIAVNSFFDLGIEPCGLNFAGFFRGMMKEAKDRAQAPAHS